MTDLRWAYEPRYPRPLPELLATMAELLARLPPTTPRRCTQHGQLSNLDVQNCASWKSSTFSLQLPRWRPGSISSNVACFSRKNNNSNWRHQPCWLSVRISLQKLMFRSSPSPSIPGPVKLELLLCSYLSHSGSAWIWLPHVDGVTDAHCSFRDNPQLSTLSQFCPCCSLIRIGSVLDNSFACARPSL